ncbi:NADH-quinone oxidoreductase subunit C [Neobacillus sp. PS3-40]|uniref:hydrogenase large subunit n=1 Tax=Neobacillus sp. PS3-40 TaxID=3070679 RepID=UPI0027DEB3E8|nr:NADH-quinone oxidoreductase subunit C [Neobacillus sp. PS3-40]WML44862.1 NADH-quinone oxidoreductase subunit C [Neobacillus sp. PS3-40]
MKIEVIHADRNQLEKAYKSVMGPHFRLLTMVASDEKELGIDRFKLRYFFAVGDNRVLVLETVVPEEDPSFSSLAELLPAAAWYEREAYDLFGTRPVGHPDLRSLILHDDFPEGVYPLRKDFPLDQIEPRSGNGVFSYPRVEGEGVFEIPVGPIHAGVIEPGHFRFQVMGDTIFHLEARLFYTHRGMEKRSEGMDVMEGSLLAEQLCGVCSVSHALSYAQAVEQIAGLTIPERALYIRSLLAEMERLYNHVGDIGNICAGIGFAFGSNHGARLKETLMQLNARIFNHRYLRGMIIPGGVLRDLTSEQLNEISRISLDVAFKIQQIIHDILENNIALDRYRKTGILKEDIAEQFAVVGPAARASNIDMDARKDFPHAAYQELQFEVPVLEDGDVLARFLIRAVESTQSAKLIRQIIEKIPKGDIRIPLGELPAYQYGIGITESPRGENVHFVMTGLNNTIYRYRVRSASYANWPAVPTAVPGNIVPDFPLINKSFELCYSCCDR